MKIDFGSGNEQYVGAYAISEDTANANSQPKDWTFEGSSNGTDWVVLDTRSNEVSANWSSGTLRYFNCQKSGLFRYYRINCTANCGATNVYCIAELELFDTRANLCQTMTSNTAPAPYAAFATSEFNSSNVAYMAFDKNVSTPTLWASSSSPSFPQNLTYYFGGDKYVFTGISFMSHKTSTYNPGSLVIQASNDNVTWDNISPTYTFTASDFGCYKYKNLSCKCNKSYRFIRLSILSKLDSPIVEVHIFELKVFGQLKDKCITPVMTSNSLPSPYVASDSVSGVSAWFAFARNYSDNGNTYWWTINPFSSSAWVKIYLGSNLVKISHIAIQTSVNSVDRSPKDFTIQGSIDDVTYFTIGTFTGVTWSALRESKEFPVTVGYWKYVKINITALQAGNLLQVSNIWLYGEQYSNLCATMTSNSLPAPYSCSASSEYSGSYASWKAFNKSNAIDPDCWASANGSVSNTWLQYYFGGISYNLKAIAMQGYYSGAEIATPTNFIIQGSNDGTNFDNIRSISGITWTSAEKKLFSINTTCSYKYLRIYINSNGGHGWNLIGELEIYGTPAKQIVNIISDITSTSYAINSKPNLFDNNISTGEQIQSTTQGFGQDFGVGVTKNIRFLRFYRQGYGTEGGTGKLQYSDNGTTWFDTNVTNIDFTYNYSGWQEFNVNDYGGHRFWQIINTTNASNWTQGTEIEMAETLIKYPDVTPPMTAASVPENWTVTANAESNGAGWYALDHSLTVDNTWSSGNFTGWWQSKLANAIAFNRIDIISHTTFVNTAPRDFEIYGSIDGSLYTLLAFFQGVIWSTNETKTFRFENNIPYSYCKINCLAIDQATYLY